MNRSLVGHQRGVGLIEVLVTVLIISTALMGLATLQSRALQYNQGSYFRSQANILAADILDRMRTYTVVETVWVGGGSLPQINAAALADVEAWKNNIIASLPNGKGTLTCVNATRICTVTIIWSNLSQSGQASDNLSTFAYTAKL